MLFAVLIPASSLLVEQFSQEGSGAWHIPSCKVHTVLVYKVLQEVSIYAVCVWRI